MESTLLSSSLLLPLVTAIIVTFCGMGVNPALAQSDSAEPGAGQSSRSSASAGDVTSLTVLTSSQIPLSPPTIQYLPGPEDCTVLVADFTGLMWKGEAKVVRPAKSGGIEEVRIGQLQENPPVCRVSVSTKKPALFKLVTFSSPPGRLIIKWSNDVSAAKAAAEREAAQTRAAVQSHRINPYTRRLTHLPPAESPRLTPAPASTASSADTNQASDYSYERHASAASLALATSNPTSSSDGLLRPSADSTPGSSAKAPTPTTPTPAPGKQQPIAQAKSTPREAIADKVEALKTGILSKFHPHSNKKQAAQAPAAQSGSPKGDQEWHDNLTLAERPNQQTSPAAATMKVTAPARALSMQDSQPTNNTESSQKNGTQSGAAPKKAPAPVNLALSSDDTAVLDNLRIEFTAIRKINYRTFRMHDPERFVVDFTQLPELESLSLPDSDSPLFYRFRVGRLPGNSDITRFVIDLPDATVSINDLYDPAQNSLDLLLTKKADIRPTVVEEPKPLKLNLSAPPSVVGADRDENRQTSVLSGSDLIGQPVKRSGALTIVLDAGHGGSDPGAQRGDVQEKDITLGITLKLKQLLEKNGMQVIMTRSNDTFVSLEDRVKVTNQMLPDLFLSVHINAMESTSDIHGIETYYQTEQSRLLADSIHQSLVDNLAAPDRSVRKARFYVINHTAVPAILAEVGYISNKEERQQLTTPEYQSKVAAALAQGLNDYVAVMPQMKAVDIAEKQPTVKPSADRHPQTHPLQLAGTSSPSAKSSSSGLEGKPPSPKDTAAATIHKQAPSAHDTGSSFGMFVRAPQSAPAVSEASKRSIPAHSDDTVRNQVPPSNFAGTTGADLDNFVQDFQNNR
jgi:N-acetylmuramoyl-L-alanine amidase CwlD